MMLQAPAKLNLCLYLGRAPRATGCTSSARSSSRWPGRPDRGCRAERATRWSARASRARTWPPPRSPPCASAAGSAPPLRVEIEKRIPVAAGLGGGSADAAAILRLAARRGRRTAALAAELGADVPSQLGPALALVARRRREGRAAAATRPSTRRCCCRTAAASRRPRSSPRPTGSGWAASAELDELAARLRERRRRRLAARLRRAAGQRPRAGGALAAPEIGEALEALREAGAPVALLSGSGPTAFGLFPDGAAAGARGRALGRDDAIVCEAGRAP